MVANSAEAAYSCAEATDAAALRTRMLQTELMVAALSCNQKEDYNSFVVRYRPQLKENGTALKRYFNRSYGNRSSQELNSFTTRLANEASKRSLSDIGKFCSDAKAVFSALETMPSVEFTTFVADRPTADAHGMSVCSKASSVVKKASLSESKAATASSRKKASSAKTAKAHNATAKSATTKSATKNQASKTKTASAKSTTAAKKTAVTKTAAADTSATTAELNKAQMAKKPTSAATQAKPTRATEASAQPKK